MDCSPLHSSDRTFKSIRTLRQHFKSIHVHDPSCNVFRFNDFIQPEVESESSSDAHDSESDTSDVHQPSSTVHTARSVTSTIRSVPDLFLSPTRYTHLHEAQDSIQQSELESPSNTNTPFRFQGRMVISQGKLWEIIFEHSLPSPFLTSPLTEDEPSQDLFCRQQSLTYHYYNSRNLGPEYLISLIHHGNDAFVGKFDPNSTRLQSSIACYLETQSRKQQREFVTILHGVVEQCLSMSYKTSLSDLYVAPIPTTFPSVRRTFLDGPKSLLHNLPHPVTEMVGDHVYVSLEEHVRELCANRNAPIHLVSPADWQNCQEVVSIDQTPQMIATNNELENIYQTPQMKARYERLCSIAGAEVVEKSVVLAITDWSDGCEKNAVKDNRGSLWAKTVTIGLPNKLSSSPEHTFPIAFGTEASNHEPVENRFKEELQKFDDGVFVYHAATDRLVKVFIILFASLQDSPERRERNYISRGSAKGSYVVRDGYAGDYQQVYDVLISCPNCRQHLKDGSTPTDCDSCTNFEFTSPHNLLDFEPPKDYPRFITRDGKKVSLLNEDGTISPAVVTYEKLLQAKSDTFREVFHGRWSMTTGKVYLRTQGINTLMRHAICSEGRDLMKLHPRNIALEDVEIPNDRIGIADPAFWTRGATVDMCLNLLMHLIFLGVNRSSTKETMEWLGIRRRQASFNRFATGLLQKIECLQLDWCRIIAFRKETFGGWLSENWLGLSRVMKWFFSRLDDLSEDRPYDEPSAHPSSWKKDELKDWLRAHGLPRSGNKDYLEEQVLRYIGENADLPYPDLAIPSGPEFSVVMDMLVSMQVMTAHIMITTVGDHTPDDIMRHVKIFLNCYCDFDNAMREETKVKMPSMLSQWNYPNLLNLPRQCQKYGSGRLMWEGGVRGEGFLRFLKPLINSGFKGEWQTNLSRRYLRRRALKRIGIESLQDIFDEAEGEADEDIRYSPFRKYNSLAVAKDCFENRQPLSLVETNDECFGMVYKVGQHELQLLHLELVPQCKEVVFGAAYFSWRRKQSHNYHLVVDNVKRKMLLLPRLDESGEIDTTSASNKYYTICDDWHEMDSDGSFCQAKIPGYKY